MSAAAQSLPVDPQMEDSVHMSDSPVEPNHVDPATDPYTPGPTPQGTMRIVIAAEVAVDDAVQLVADSPFLEGIDDEIVAKFATADPSLVASVAESVKKNWPSSSRLVGVLRVSVGGTSISVPITDG